jgi:hypothetical protein
MESESRNYEKDWQEFWKDIVTEYGNLDLEQIKKELSDYKMMMETLSEINSELSDGLLSYPTYPAKTILNVFYEKFINKEFAKEDVINIIKSSGDIEEIIEEIEKYFG